MTLYHGEKKVKIVHRMPSAKITSLWRTFLYQPEDQLNMVLVSRLVSNFQHFKHFLENLIFCVHSITLTGWMWFFFKFHLTDKGPFKWCARSFGGREGGSDRSVHFIGFFSMYFFMHWQERGSFLARTLFQWPLSYRIYFIAKSPPQPLNTNRLYVKV